MRFTRVTLFFIAFIITLGFYQLARHLLAEAEPQTFLASEEMMVDTANLLAEIAAEDIRGGSFDTSRLRRVFDAAHSRRFEALIFDHLKKSVGINAYLTDSRGKVVFDSDGGRREGQDLSGMIDVGRTLSGKYGARSTRLDPDDSSTSVMYVAAPVGDSGDPAGVLTVYKPKRDLIQEIRKRRRIIYTACGLIGGGILFLIAAVFLWLFHPIGKITEYAHAIERGERPPKPEIGIGREVNTLARALDSMRDALEDRKYVERYIQTLTHEMKSPLAAIRGAAELLDEEMPLDTRRRFLGNIRAETARSERLINRLLELAAIESRKRLESAEDSDFRDIVSRAIDQAKPLADLAAVDLSVDTGDTPAIIRADAFILRAAVTNLLENAIDFSPRGGVVEIRLATSGNQLRLTVRDHGEGIPEYAREKVFERFYSLRHHSAGRKGTGLGLTLVRETVELHGGSITLHPTEGGGTVATLELPVT
jgi:two-component system, OmpR family, sensor histidine kinase CreC